MLVRGGSGMSEEDAKLSVLRHKKHVSCGCIGQLGFEIQCSMRRSASTIIFFIGRQELGA